jgi:predicted AlkP superfamily phosphohydrolase/phosphomutase
MTKILIIGIDALDSETITKHISDLPNFRKLVSETGEINFDGVFPPDSPTSWGSIYTGLNPAKHGIVLFVDPLKRVSKMITKDVDDRAIHGKTFWDLASAHGKKVCILPHLLGYPVWPVNGVMIGRSGVSGDIQIYPPEKAETYDISKFKWNLGLFPGRNKKKYIELTKEQIRKEMEFGLKMLKNTNWDLFFISFGELDSIQYSFWNYYDKEDPSYPGKNSYETLIPEFYKLYDDLIGKFMSIAGQETITVVVSDHGIGSRPVKLININELLCRNGFLKLKSKEKKGLSATQRFIQSSKRTILKTVSKHDLGNIAAAIIRLFPKGKEWFISSDHVDWNNTLAYLSDQSGIKNYPYGGITVLKNKNYEEIRDTIIKELSGIKDPTTGEKIANWVCKREDLYSGEYIENYPDIVFDLKEDYGAGTSVPANLFDESLSHSIVPGCHKQHNATFLISENYEKKEHNMTLIDFAPTVLGIIGVDTAKYEFDGKDIFRNDF